MKDPDPSSSSQQHERGNTMKLQKRGGEHGPMRRKSLQPAAGGGSGGGCHDLFERLNGEGGQHRVSSLPPPNPLRSEENGSS